MACLYLTSCSMSGSPKTSTASTTPTTMIALTTVVLHDSVIRGGDKVRIQRSRVAKHSAFDSGPPDTPDAELGQMAAELRVRRHRGPAATARNGTIPASCEVAGLDSVWI